jgi:hypothetical protein
MLFPGTLNCVPLMYVGVSPELTQSDMSSLLFSAYRQVSSPAKVPSRGFAIEGNSTVLMCPLSIENEEKCIKKSIYVDALRKSIAKELSLSGEAQILCQNEEDER